MYKIGKVFMEDVTIKLNPVGLRVIICPICENEIFLTHDESVNDTILCELCDTPLKIVE